jgi:hypothetical protein
MSPSWSSGVTSILAAVYVQHNLSAKIPIRYWEAIDQAELFEFLRTLADCCVSCSSAILDIFFKACPVLPKNSDDRRTSWFAVSIRWSSLDFSFISDEPLLSSSTDSWLTWYCFCAINYLCQENSMTDPINCARSPQYGLIAITLLIFWSICIAISISRYRMNLNVMKIIP